MKKNTKIIKNKLEESIMLMILSCIKELEIKVGVNKLTSILIGSESNYIFENEFNKNSYYGFLQNYNSKQVRKIIDRLYTLNLIESVDVEGEYYTSTINLTKKGNSSIDKLSIKNPDFFDKIIKIKKTDLDKESKELFNKLRLIRNQIAKSIDKPAFVICSDKTLRSVAKNKPNDPSSLLEIKGIGNHFIKEYSDLFLNEIMLNAA